MLPECTTLKERPPPICPPPPWLAKPPACIPPPAWPPPPCPPPRCAHTGTASRRPNAAMEIRRRIRPYYSPLSGRPEEFLSALRGSSSQPPSSPRKAAESAETHTSGCGRKGRRTSEMCFLRGRSRCAQRFLSALRGGSQRPLRFKLLFAEFAEKDRRERRDTQCGCVGLSGLRGWYGVASSLRPRAAGCLHGSVPAGSARSSVACGGHSLDR